MSTSIQIAGVAVVAGFPRFESTVEGAGCGAKKAAFLVATHPVGTIVIGSAVLNSRSNGCHPIGTRTEQKTAEKDTHGGFVNEFQ